MAYTVYDHITPSGKHYIGITSQKPQKRWGKDGNGYKHQTFYRAVTKYGWNNIEHKILLEGVEKSEAVYAERYLIA